ncbi:somatomedin B and thrombospondin type 1 domain containing protein vexed [Arctopsyche grandis]|uniref:somatomedin B and thrombospondin type 1 domain containing protein vexed n=1 Tax=Arctopsyche grandis TaxID=121162 RepID=UPI00406D7441
MQMQGTLLWCMCALSWLSAPCWGGSCHEAKLCCPGRDSSCVVQNAPLNAVVEDLNDKPCYCDHACLKLGDCCTDFKDACGVVDCQVTAWGAWSSCDSSCGPGSMSRSRRVSRGPQHGGRRCPGLLQRRACQGGDCPLHTDTAAREIAMLLPASLSESRKVNQTEDIRNNLRLRNPEDPEMTPQKEYCVEFEILKASKACRKETSYKALQEGERVCVRCESEALRKSLDWRCQGHGVMSRSTRFSALSAPHCHGKWLRITPDDDDDYPMGGSNSTNSESCAVKSCSKNGPQFIFV